MINNTIKTNAINIGFKRKQSVRSLLLLCAIFIFNHQALSQSHSQQSDWLTESKKSVHGLSMFDDLKYPKGFPHFDYVNPNAPKQGSIRLGSSTSFDSFNPFIRKGIVPDGMNLLGGLPYDTLTVSSDDEAFSQYGLVAESIFIADDRLSIHFFLNPAATFHDGKPITADDVVFSFNILKEKGNPFFKYYYGEISQAEKIDDHHVKLHLTNPDNSELPLIAGQLPILPKHYWQNKDFSQTTLTPPLSSGPYRIKEFEAGRYIIYERVKDYWAKDLAVNKGRYNFDEIRYDIYRDDTVLRQAFKAGKVDYRAENSAKAWEKDYQGDLLNNRYIIQETFPTLTPIVSTGMGFNLRRDKFQNRNVREAINLAFDFEWTNKNVFYDQYLRADSFFPESVFHVDGLPKNDELSVLNDYRDLLPDYVFNEPIAISKSDGTGWNRQNLIKAAQILKNEGYRVVNNALVNESGEPFVIEFLIVSPSFKRILLPFQRNLSMLGIDLSIRLVDSAAYQNRLQEFDFDMIVFGAGQSLNPGNEQKEYWGSEAANNPATRNVMGIQNPAIDAIIDNVITANSREELVTAVKAMNRILTKEAYMIPGWHLPARRLVYWNYFSQPKEVNPNVSPIHPGADFLNWWYDTEKAAKLDAAKQTNTALGK